MESVRNVQSARLVFVEKMKTVIRSVINVITLDYVHHVIVSLIKNVRVVVNVKEC